MLTGGGGKSVDVAELIPDTALREEIEAWVAAHRVQPEVATGVARL